jgi:hypothetical protein
MILLSQLNGGSFGSSADGSRQVQMRGSQSTRLMWKNKEKQVVQKNNSGKYSMELTGRIKFVNFGNFASK